VSGPGPGRGPLAGLRVLDLSRLLPGGYATLLLADLGADVIKVEQPGSGDHLRWVPPYASTGEGGPHLALNRGKRSVTADLRAEDGKAFLRDLAATADVLVESFRPGVLDRLGVGYEALKEVAPGLVYVAISGYGATGPRVAAAGHDIDYLAYGGALSFTGSPASGPWQPGLQIGDLGGGGLMAVVAALAALRERERTGRGQFCDVSMTDGVLSWLTIHAGAVAAGGPPPAPGTDALNGGLACYGVYPCSDGRSLAVGALEPQFFHRLLAGLGLGDLEALHVDPSRQAELRERIAEVLLTRARDEWVEHFDGLDACVAPVLDLDEALEDPGNRGRDMVVDQQLSDGSTFRQLGVVPRLAGTPGQVGGPPSALGADTEDLLHELGRSTDEVQRLRGSGAV
jgi:alpha-methylacyl-CoA racemase